MRRFFALLFLPVLSIGSLSSCSNQNSFEEQVIGKLKEISSIKEINVFENKNKSFKCGLELYFEMPVDWNNVDGDKFKQRVVVDARSFDIPTVVELQGYDIGAKYIDEGYTRELATLIDSNFVVIEHRFFTKSKYEKANYEKAAGWEQLTVKNAAKDHNFIIGELRKVFTKKWIATGHSKGGYITNALACLYPETCDAYLPFVAPCLTQFDSRPSEFINNEAGVSTYGEVEAKRIRDNILKYQVFCYQHKNELIPELFSEKYLSPDCLFREALTKENLFDINMLDFSYGFWQYGYTDINVIDDFLSLPEETEEDVNNKIDVALKIMSDSGSTMSNMAYNSFFPYLVTAYKEMGNYTNNFSYVKDMAESLGISINISIPKGKEIEYSNKANFSEDQLNNFAYDATMYNTLNEWISDKNLQTKIIMINGQEDPWFHGSISLPDTLGENVKVYTHPKCNHKVQISSFDEPIKNEILSYIRTWLDIK